MTSRAPTPARSDDDRAPVPARRRRSRPRRGLALGAVSLSAVLGLSALPATATAAPVVATRVAPAPGAPAADGSFVSPAMADRPMYRFWNGGGLMTAESIAAQVAQMKEAGAGGFEANSLSGEVTQNSIMPGYKAAEHGFGTPAWSRAWSELLREGKAQGMQVDSLYTPGWSAGIQGISFDEPGTAKELVYGSAFLDGGESFDGPLPTAALPQGVTRRVLEGVVAYRCVSRCSDGSVPELDPSTATDLTTTVANGNLAYTAPVAAGRQVIVAAWSQGTGQTIRLADTATPSNMVDHFGAAGGQAIVDYWENTVLTPELRAAMRASGGSLFFDSLEINRYGQEVRHWTDDFLAEFRERRGYSLRPYIATLATADPVALTSKPVFELADGVGRRVREDYQQTLSELFVQNHIELLKTWAKGYGMTVRGQAYVDWGPGAVNRADAAIALDGAEQEANNRTDDEHPLFTTEASDSWRQIASAHAQTGGNLISYEAGTFGRADGLARTSLIAKINSQFALGMNKVIYHGWADQSPGTAAAWPGYSPFKLGAPETHGVMVPQIADDRAMNDYVGRMQTVLRRGQLTHDVAVFWDGTGEASYRSDGLADAGYSYGFLNNTLAMDPSATLKDGRLSDLGYRALVLDGTSTSVPMDLATAKRVLGWARRGFPVIVVGDLGERGRGYRSSEDGAYTRVVDELLAQDSVTSVTSLGRVVGALRAVGVDADAGHRDEPLVSLHRKDDDSDYYYLFNSGDARTSATVTLRGEGRPYRYDGWTGAVTPVAEFTRTADGVQVEVDLATGEGELIALTTGNADTPANACAVGVDDTTADEVRDSGGSLVVRDTAAGTYDTRLSDGTAVSTAIDTVGEAVEPTAWDLVVTSWTAGPGGPADTAMKQLPRIALTAGDDGTLPDWQEVDGLAKVSGTSTYTTTIDTGAGWTGGAGAYLDLGTVLGTAQVSVNGKRLEPVDQVDVHRIDLGDSLTAGTNTLTVHVATPVYNAGYGTDHAYGLVGPVVVQPYGERTLAAPCVTKGASRITASATRSTYGRPTTVTAKVSVDGASAPGGRVAVSEGDRVLGTGDLQGDTASASLGGTVLPAGTHRLTVAYLGGDTAEPSSTMVTVATAKASTTTSLTAKDRTIKRGGTLRTTVRVAAPGVTPTGTVSLTYRGRTVRKNVTLRGGTATVTFRPGVRGRHTLRATYRPDADFASSRDSIRVRVR